MRCFAPNKTQPSVSLSRGCVQLSSHPLSYCSEISCLAKPPATSVPLKFPHFSTINWWHCFAITDQQVVLCRGKSFTQGQIRMTWRLVRWWISGALFCAAASLFTLCTSRSHLVFFFENFVLKVCILTLQTFHHTKADGNVAFIVFEILIFFSTIKTFDQLDPDWLTDWFSGARYPTTLIIILLRLFSLLVFCCLYPPINDKHETQLKWKYRHINWRISLLWWIRLCWELKYS